MASRVKDLQHERLAVLRVASVRAGTPSLSRWPESAHHATYDRYLSGMAYTGLSPAYQTQMPNLMKLMRYQFGELTEDVSDEIARRTTRESTRHRYVVCHILP
ncbi:hypothetical protein PLICRDRAFT_454069 [Plicaturopsis crispa FD-325 SS-3]|uniref:GIT Spa2 homology (SHD) domain-containing protein n=1 Tax=Plicaturopsis crispa FD-325 SS-3 TaxID=944288 RepID=A0A0C9T5C9_PLICR|nr:hypothetical protein PLICRDRAFT_454069 [Plicaturopsis crispa FD-325 SS-3]